MEDVTVVTATSLEYKTARRELPGIRVVEAGVALRSLRDPLAGSLISCGLAGGLHHHHPTGTVLVPGCVLRPDGTSFACDAELVERLSSAARALQVPVSNEPLVTTTHIVRGRERERWSALGYAAVDMETGLLVSPRIAAVRVILDTPLRELSEDWLNPALAAVKPWNWPQMVWLARHGPACARTAARVVAGALL